MKFNVTNVRRALQQFNLQHLFLEELGWDFHRHELTVRVQERDYRLRAVAQKRGFAVYVCDELPLNAVRRAIDVQVTKHAREHFVIYCDRNAGTQLWQWVRRERGSGIASRDLRVDVHKSAQLLIEKLEQLAIALEDEEQTDLLAVRVRVSKAFDVDKVTKRFYERFKGEHSAFLKEVAGIDSEDDREWYTSLMLNRLMFVYFIQKKGFLAADRDYLRNRLRQVQERYGSGRFHSFYRSFLLHLFHDGLGRAVAQRRLDAELTTLIGEVPYLNGGFFEVHPLEQQYPAIAVPDAAFTRLFDFFDGYNWHLDDRPLRADNEINPDVIGYIFEKYINQKQMGAYYTKEDITEYISRNTVIPFLFDRAARQCAVAFTPDSALWRLLREDPERYIFSAVRHGVLDTQGAVLPLPAEIAAGIDDVSQRGGWNRPADEGYGLPTETWREYVARRRRCLELRERLHNGEVTAINDLITLNLDIVQFARDAIISAEGPELVRAFWDGLRTISVLDPTCGSGAFLFAALRILEVLYSDALERMRRFIADAPATQSGRTPPYQDFRAVLEAIDGHPNERYFILKSIMVNNLYGVDIMAEAVEIAKLRLFLKLVAQVDDVRKIEPLPDIDFNIQAGNTLVGFATLRDVEQALNQKLDLFNDAERISEEAKLVGAAYRAFRDEQTGYAGSDPAALHKQRLRERLQRLAGELDRYLAAQYGVDPDDTPAFTRWQQSHQPFHWCVAFYELLQRGGFDVVVGNPPYVEYSKVKSDYSIKGYRTERCGNLYAFITERAVDLLTQSGQLGLIVPLSITSSQRMKPVQDLVVDMSEVLHVSNFALRPAALFPGVMQRLTIVLLKRGNRQDSHTTDYITWYSEERTNLFALIRYESLRGVFHPVCIPKFRDKIARSILLKMIRLERKEVDDRIKGKDHIIYYHNAGGYWVKALNQRPFYRSLDKQDKRHTTISELKMASNYDYIIYLAILNSSLFYFYWKSTTDARHVNPSDISLFPIGKPISSSGFAQLATLCDELMTSLENNKKRITYGRAEVDQYSVSPSKPIIDEIDRVLAQHYGFTDEELDYIINYDIKFRMGGADDGGEDDA